MPGGQPEPTLLKSDRIVTCRELSPDRWVLLGQRFPDLDRSQEVILAFGWTAKLGQVEVSLGKRCPETVFRRAVRRPGAREWTGPPGFDLTDFEILPERLVDRADPEVGSAHFMADLGIAGIPALERLETLQSVIQQVAAHGFCLGNASEPLVGDPYKHLGDRRQSVACVLLGV